MATSSTSSIPIGSPPGSASSSTTAPPPAETPRPSASPTPAPIQLVAADLLDGPNDGVVGDGPPELLDELDGGEVAHSVAVFDGGAAEGDEVVGLAGAGGADEAQVVGSTDPVERDQVVVAGPGDGGLGEVELVEGLVDGESCGGEPVAGVRFVAGGDLQLDEDSQGLLWGPALRLGGEQQLRCLAADGRQLEPLEAGLEVVGQRRWCGAGAHTRPPMR